MNGTAFLDEQIKMGKPVTIRLLEGRDIQAILVAQDSESIIIKRKLPGEAPNEEFSLIYKRAISVITP